MKRVFTLIAVLGLSASLGAQSLVELAKKEKARRESLKTHAAVIKQADLLRVEKAPAVEVVPPEPDIAEEILGEGAGVEPDAIAGEAGSASLPSGSGAPGRRIVPAVGPEGPLITGEANRDQEGPGGTLEAQLTAAKDLVDLLTTKMNALRQQFEYQDAMVPGYVIQQQLDETNQRLVKAQAQQARIEAQIEKRTSGKKSPAGEER
jgi:hypothetical protein